MVMKMAMSGLTFTCLFRSSVVTGTPKKKKKDQKFIYCTVVSPCEMKPGLLAVNKFLDADINRAWLTPVSVGVAMLSQGHLDVLDLLRHSRKHSLFQTVELVKATPGSNLAQAHEDPTHGLRRKD